MTRISLMVRAICDYAQAGDLSISPAGLICHRGDPISDDDAQQVITLLDEGVLMQDGDRIVPALTDLPGIDELLARYRISEGADR